MTEQTTTQRLRSAMSDAQKAEHDAITAYLASVSDTRPPQHTSAAMWQGLNFARETGR